MEPILRILKLTVDRGEAVLRIDSGFNGMEYRFVQDAGTIRAVKTTASNNGVLVTLTEFAFASN